MEIVAGRIRTNELSARAAGGSELIARKIAEVVDESLLAEFQIINTRVRELEKDLIRVLVVHDLPGDPELEHLKNGGWKRFHKIVFVSHWQAQQFCAFYRIPGSAVAVVKNAIVPIDRPEVLSGGQTVRIIYHTTPHRGLEILVPVVEKMAAAGQDVHLDVFSSFGIYGWEQRDEPYRRLFDEIRAHDRMTYHGFTTNEEVKQVLAGCDVFAYPSIWMETSCICLMEAMSAGLACVHPNLGALPETAGCWTSMYQWSEDKDYHSGIFEAALTAAVESVRSREDSTRELLVAQKKYADLFYGWDLRKREWEALLKSLLSTVKDRSIKEQPKEMFSYSTGD